jgi:hypothetical protein
VLDSYLHQSQAEAHLAAARVGLMQMLQTSRLSQREIAGHLKIGETYLSKVLHEDSSEKIPASLVQRLVFLLGAPRSLHNEIQWHLENVAGHKKITKLALHDEASQPMFETVFQQRISALHSQEPSQAKRYFLQCSNYGVHVIEILLARKAYYHAARVALVLNDIFHTLNRLADAMYYAKLASQLLFSPPLDLREQFEDFKEYYVNALYAEGVTLRLLGFHRQARKKQQEIISQYPSSAWYAHAHRENLLAYLLNTRIQKKVAFDLLKAHQVALGALESSDKAIWEFSAQRNEAEVWLGLGFVGRSLEMLSDLFPRLNFTSGTTNVHQVSFLRLYGKAFFQARQKQQADAYLQQGLALAMAAGLTHQQSWIEADLQKF